MRTVAIIQARMASTRLPGKIMADLAGKPLLYHVVSRALQARTLDLVALATTDRSIDDEVAKLCDELGIPCFRGSEEDVLDRYYQAAKYFDADVVVRLTADCPMIDPLIIDKVVQVLIEEDFEYVSNILDCTYPDGLDTEAFYRKVLERAWREANLKSDREHVTTYLRNHPEWFRLKNVSHTENLSSFRWTVDEPQDLEFVRRVYEYLGPDNSFGMTEILALLQKYPELKDINTGINRNEGYQKALTEDTLI